MQDDFLKVIGWEYSTLRTEIQECFQHSFRIFSWGTGLILGASPLILKYLPPEALIVIMVASLVLDVIWLGQMVRINRAGQYLRFTEAKINAYLEASVANWKPVCSILQDKVEVVENELRMPNFGYDFTKPLYWETWLSNQRGKTKNTGHLDWLYLIEAGVFPGVFLLCPFIYIFLKGASPIWYIIWSEITIILVIFYWWIGKKLGLVK